MFNSWIWASLVKRIEISISVSSSDKEVWGIIFLIRAFIFLEISGWVFQSFSLGVYIVIALVAFFTMIFILSSKSLNMQASYKKIIFAFIIGLVVFFISPNKDNGYLIFTFVPVAIMLTNYLETIEKYWIKESILGIILFSILLNFALRLL